MKTVQTTTSQRGCLFFFRMTHPRYEERQVAMPHSPDSVRDSGIYYSQEKPVPDDDEYSFGTDATTVQVSNVTQHSSIMMANRGKTIFVAGCRARPEVASFPCMAGGARRLGIVRRASRVAGSL